MRRLATSRVNSEGIRHFVLGPIKDLDPEDREAWHRADRVRGDYFQQVYMALWMKYSGGYGAK